MSNPDAKVPCKFCGDPTRYTGTEQCPWCWEVNCRIDRFVRTEAGRARVAQAIALAESQRADTKGEAK